MNHVSALNLGVISSGQSAPGSSSKPGNKTIIVTGVARSGTSLIAALLKEAGVYIGEFVYDVVNEDAQVLELLRSHDTKLLKTLIRQRNARHATWGFKIPNLHAYLTHDDLALFRNPYLVVVCRDPVAVAVRNALSEHYAEMDALLAAASAMHAMVHFVRRARCPVLMLSYEKALNFPNTVIDSLTAFCQIELDDFQRNKMFVQVQPNRAEYLLAATRRFIGRIDGVMRGQIYGWCLQDGRTEPVQVDVFADGALLETVRADLFRQDLATQGSGNGCHGFSVHLGRFALKPDAVITARVSGRTIELENSGKRLVALAAPAAA